MGISLTFSVNMPLPHVLKFEKGPPSPSGVSARVHVRLTFGLATPSNSRLSGPYKGPRGIFCVLVGGY